MKAFYRSCEISNASVIKMLKILDALVDSRLELFRFRSLSSISSVTFQPPLGLA